MIELFNNDCLIKMQDIPDKSVDLICTDPPFNIGKDKRWDKWKTVESYVEFMGKVFKEFERVLKDNGSFYFFHNDFLQIVELQNWINRNTRFVFKQLITWSKINPNFSNFGFVQQRLSIDMMRNYYNGFTEYCLFYTFQDETGLKQVYDDRDCFSEIKQYLRNERSKVAEANGVNLSGADDILANITNTSTIVRHYWGDAQWMIPTKEMYQMMQSTGFFSREYESLRQEYENLRQEYESLRLEYESLRYTFNTQQTSQSLLSNSNTWQYENAKNIGHCTPKPVDLIENIIKHSSNEGDLVLDAFLGSGTTGVACVNLNRSFIGIELDPDYFAIATKRIENAKIQKESQLY